MPFIAKRYNMLRICMDFISNLHISTNYRCRSSDSCRLDHIVGMNIVNNGKNVIEIATSAFF